MPNRVILLTGATDGLGRALAQSLAGEPDTTLILHGRDPGRLAELASSFQGAAATVHTVRADLSDLAQVRGLAKDVAALTERLSVLVNNAGIGSGEPDGRERRVSADGYELRFAVNHLAAFALTQHLLPLLEAGARPGSSTSPRPGSPRSTSPTRRSSATTPVCRPTGSPNWP